MLRWLSDRPRATLCLIWTLATAINLTKAFHIDDTAYVLTAQWIRDHPLHPTSGVVFWRNVPEPIAAINQPHFLFYLMSLWMRLFGSSEIALHLLQSLFTLGGIFAFFAVSKIVLQRDSMMPVVLLFLGPAVLPSQNVMVDVPVLCFWIVFFWGILAASQPVPRAHGLTVAAFASAAAILTKYSSLPLIPTLAYFLIRLRRTDAWYLLLIPLSALAGWSAFNYWESGQVHLLTREAGGVVGRIQDRIPEWLVALGAVAPLFVLSQRRIFPGSRLLSAAAIVASVLFGLEAGMGYLAATDHEREAIHWANTALAAIFASNGLWLTLSAGAAIFRHHVTRPDSIAAECLALWVASAALFIWLFAPFMAVRHLLPALPPIILAFFLAREREPRQAGLYVAVALTVALGLVLSISDRLYAEAYRAEAGRIREHLGPSQRIWFTGHWGWQWYALTAGMEPYEPEGSRLESGDMVVEPEIVAHQEITDADRARLRKVQNISVNASAATTVRTVSNAPWGGFYLSTTTALPWKLSREPLENFAISVVQAR